MTERCGFRTLKKLGLRWPFAPWELWDVQVASVDLWKVLFGVWGCGAQLWGLGRSMWGESSKPPSPGIGCGVALTEFIEGSMDFGLLRKGSEDLTGKLKRMFVLMRFVFPLLAKSRPRSFRQASRIVMEG